MSIQGGSGFHVTETGPVVTGPGGILHTVTVNTGQSGASVTLYDGDSDDGAVIAVIAATETITLTYDVKLNSGLYADVSGTTAPDLTIVLLPPPGSAL